MAMYEDRGYCPGVAFGILPSVHNGDGTISELWDETSKILGNRKEYMVYPEFSGYYMIFDVLMSGILGIKVATALQVMMPVCLYPEFGRPIVIHDHKDLSDVPSYVCNAEALWNPDMIILDPKREYENGVPRTVGDHTVILTVAVLEDEHYLVVIEDNGEEIHMHIYQKCNP